MSMSRLMLVITVLTSFAVATATAADSAHKLVSGDLNIWDRIFASRKPQILLDGPSNSLEWTEGPVILGTKLFFSDTIGDNSYVINLDDALEEASTKMSDGRSSHLRLIKERSGENPPEDDHWRAEPGPNGLALMPNTSDSDSPEMLICQHGARRLSIMDTGSGQTRSLASEYMGKRLNGPNDVVVRNEGMQWYAYYTDPVYAWFEKERHTDMPYLDDQVKTKGPGFCGVYRVEITPSSVNFGNVELISSDMPRPNGLLFNGDDLIVADCCQGSHVNNCTSGTSRWEILRQRNNLDSSWVHNTTVEDMVSQNEADGGCADGMALYTFDDISLVYGSRKTKKKRVLLASCFGGLCIVDLELGKVVARMWTAKKDYGGCRISNVAVVEEYGIAILTGNCGVQMLPLHGNTSATAGEDEMHQEL